MVPTCTPLAPENTPGPGLSAMSAAWAMSVDGWGLITFGAWGIRATFVWPLFAAVGHDFYGCSDKQWHADPRAWAQVIMPPFLTQRLFTSPEFSITSPEATWGPAQPSWGERKKKKKRKILTQRRLYCRRVLALRQGPIGCLLFLCSPFSHCALQFDNAICQGCKQAKPSWG